VAIEKYRRARGRLDGVDFCAVDAVKEWITDGGRKKKKISFVVI
jgi:hypothetical protein